MIMISQQEPSLKPSKCRCGVPFDIDHVMSYRHGAFQSLQHNDTRDLLAGLFAEVCSDVCVEPRLQPLSGESLPAPAKKDDEARLDIRVRGFWGIRHQDAFFDVIMRVFYPFAPSYRNFRIQTVYRQHETQKRQHYGRRGLDVERGCFTPPVFTTGGRMAQEATACLKRLASLLSERRNELYCTVMEWLRCTILLCLLRSSLACVRGSLKCDLTETPNAHDICEAVTSARIAVI